MDSLPSFDVLLSLGTNQGDRLQNLEKATQRISQTVGKVLAVSSVYETSPWGFEATTFFMNQVLLIRTELVPEMLLSLCKSIESEMGRPAKRTGTSYETRIIDIDILFFADWEIESDFLQVPHPRLHLRKFVLLPLNELAADWLHPVLLKEVNELLLACDDPGSVEKVS
jgi:2-amino-4-hydroxy-6-hydroxymethyldihydropteridine diphosphokinase